jgi:hypothetical protein
MLTLKEQVDELLSQSSKATNADQHGQDEQNANEQNDPDRSIESLPNNIDLYCQLDDGLIIENGEDEYYYDTGLFDLDMSSSFNDKPASNHTQATVTIDDELFKHENKVSRSSSSSSGIGSMCTAAAPLSQLCKITPPSASKLPMPTFARSCGSCSSSPSVAGSYVSASFYNDIDSRESTNDSNSNFKQQATNLINEQNANMLNDHLTKLVVV